MTLYNPTCPYCKSDNTKPEIAAKSDTVRAAFAIVSAVLLILPLVKVNVRCMDCGKVFPARGSKSLYAKDEAA